MGNLSTKPDTKLSIIEQYINAIHEPICFYNATVSVKDEMEFKSLNNNETNGNYQSQHLVAYTEGLNKPINNELLTDFNFKGEMTLEKRCKLLKDYLIGLYTFLINDWLIFKNDI